MCEYLSRNNDIFKAIAWEQYIIYQVKQKSGISFFVYLSHFTLHTANRMLTKRTVYFTIQEIKNIIKREKNVTLYTTY